ncbi:MAG: hypothetical protein ACUVSY_04460 [Roseiflexus sp.]
MELLPAPRTFAYRIDNHDRITFFNEEWLEFARENDGADLTPTNVWSRPIWKFISDPETRHLYRLILSRVRSGKTITVHMRCDSPTARRIVELQIAPLPDGSITFDSRITHEEARAYAALLDARCEHSSDVVSMCSWCKKVYVPGEGWFEVEEAVQRLHLPDDTPPPQVANMVCYDCYREVVDRLFRQ